MIEVGDKVKLLYATPMDVAQGLQKNEIYSVLEIDRKFLPHLPYCIGESFEGAWGWVMKMQIEKVTVT